MPSIDDSTKFLTPPRKSERRRIVSGDGIRGGDGYGNGSEDGHESGLDVKPASTDVGETPTRRERRRGERYGYDNNGYGSSDGNSRESGGDHADDGHPIDNSINTTPDRQDVADNTFSSPLPHPDDPLPSIEGHSSSPALASPSTSPSPSPSEASSPTSPSFPVPLAVSSPVPDVQTVPRRGDAYRSAPQRHKSIPRSVPEPQSPLNRDAPDRRGGGSIARGGSAVDTPTRQSYKYHSHFDYKDHRQQDKHQQDKYDKQKHRRRTSHSTVLSATSTVSSFPASVTGFDGGMAFDEPGKAFAPMAKRPRPVVRSVPVEDMLSSVGKRGAWDKRGAVESNAKCDRMRDLMTPTDTLSAAGSSRSGSAESDGSGSGSGTEVRALILPASPSPTSSTSDGSMSTTNDHDHHHHHNHRNYRYGTHDSHRNHLSPTYHTPLPQPQPPLVLLHITLLPPPTPILPFSPAALAALAPATVPIQRYARLLQEKLDAQVLARGILVAHPREDYELLEERVLESLELVVPRVSVCGHFLGGPEGVADVDVFDGDVNGDDERERMEGMGEDAGYASGGGEGNSSIIDAYINSNGSSSPSPSSDAQTPSKTGLSSPSPSPLLIKTAHPHCSTCIRPLRIPFSPAPAYTPEKANTDTTSASRLLSSSSTDAKFNTNKNSSGNDVKSSTKQTAVAKAEAKGSITFVSPRWDVRVYAANGLMRAGAWATAWREMERVDVQIGVWVPEGLRAGLEEWERANGVDDDEGDEIEGIDGVEGDENEEVMREEGKELLSPTLLDNGSLQKVAEDGHGNGDADVGKKPLYLTYRMDVGGEDNRNDRSHGQEEIQEEAADAGIEDPAAENDTRDLSPLTPEMSSSPPPAPPAINISTGETTDTVLTPPLAESEPTSPDQTYNTPQPPLQPHGEQAQEHPQPHQPTPISHLPSPPLTPQTPIEHPAPAPTTPNTTFSPQAHPQPQNPSPPSTFPSSSPPSPTSITSLLSSSPSLPHNIIILILSLLVAFMALRGPVVAPQLPASQLPLQSLQPLQPAIPAESAVPGSEAGGSGAANGVVVDSVPEILDDFKPDAGDKIEKGREPCIERASDGYEKHADERNSENIVANDAAVGTGSDEVVGDYERIATDIEEFIDEL